jgi:hypothetical protein
MALNQMAGTLVGVSQGPVLVVGGAPSVPEEWAWLRGQGLRTENLRVIGANDHAHFYGFEPDYVCANNDRSYRHGGAPFEPILRGLMPKARLLSHHWWADYRSSKLRPANSGMKAIQYAVAMGGNPVIVIGIQHYNTPKPYGHEDKYTETRKVSGQAKPGGYFTQQEKILVEECAGAPIRTVSGPLCKLFPKYDPDEKFAPRAMTPLDKLLRAEADGARYVLALQDSVAFNNALVPEGVVFAVSAEEARRLNREHFEDVTDLCLNDPENVRLRAAERCREEAVRLGAMCHRVRSTGAGVRRGIADSDIIGILKLHQTGAGVSVISRRYALPERQIEWILRVAGVEDARAVRSS